MFCEDCGYNLDDNDIFCGQCGVNLNPQNLTEEEVINHCEEELIKKYFRDGYPYNTIIAFLEERHGIDISLRTLKRRLSKFNLKKNQNINNSALKVIIAREIEGSASNVGYRGMQGILRSTYGIMAPRNTVMNTLKELNPTATCERRSRQLKRRHYKSDGPNDTWHTDGYDKLKPYGLPIHGAVDGFSRKVLWLKVCKSNNNPNIPALFYIETIKELGFCPKLLRTDAGTENGLMASIHCVLCNSLTAHKYGTSVANQRIENWWSTLRRSYTGWLIDFFKARIAEGAFVTGSELHNDISWFSFSYLLQKDLSDFQTRWNTHRIRKSRNDVIGGIPNELFYLPERFGFQNCGLNVTHRDIYDIDGVRNVMERAIGIHTDREIVEEFKNITRLENLTWPPHNWTEATTLFDKLLGYYNA